MTRRLLPVWLALLVLLGGCNLAPQYRRPEAPVPAQWPKGEAYRPSQVAPGAPAVAQLKWQDFFRDQRLQKIITMALENNRDLRLAALNVERARALYGIQRAELFPQVQLGAGAQKQRTAVELTTPGNPRTSEKYNIDLGVVAWEIDFFGRIRSLEEQALQEYLATEQARRSVQIMLVSETARTYLALAADRDNLRLAQETLQSQQYAYDLVKKRFDVGAATELDLFRAETPLQTAKVDIARYQQFAAQSLNALNLLAGASVPRELLPAGLDDLTGPEEVSAGLSSEVLLQRPDIMAAEHRLMGAYALIGAARAAFFPRIVLTGSVGTASNQLSDLFGAGSDTWNFAPRLIMPIFDPRVWAALRVSEADQKIILTQYEKTIQTAFREVADTLAVKGTIGRQLSAQQALVNAEKNSYRLSAQRYVNGIDNYLGVLYSQQSLFTSQKVLVILRLAKLANQVKLYEVLGGGAY
ncbi:efflux transporter outer membrane subunit [Desulfoferula mesophila]|uniref:efflux transporter outer membrane subunit n=1 Tax=Desulfoferula mesophila TaxID=3058419 RepID=UPI0030D06F02